MSNNYAEACDAGRQDAARAIEAARSGLGPLALQAAFRDLQGDPGKVAGFWAHLADGLQKTD